MLESKEIKTDTVTFDRESYKVYAVGSDVCDWGYVLTVPDSERIAVIKRIALLAIFILIIAIGIGSIII